MKPIIGITCDYLWNSNILKLNMDYCKVVYRAGGIPIVLPCVSVDTVWSLLSGIDGVLLTGGQDVDPGYYGQSPHHKLGEVNPFRDEMEIELCRQAIDKEKPILGICRGMQVMNVAAGGTLYQDIKSQWELEGLINHSQKAPGWYGIHEVTLKSGSKIRRIMGQEVIRVNSFHHQAVRKVAPSFCATGWSCDGVIEAIESGEKNFAVGVQWHPERMYEYNKNMLALIKELIQACKGKTEQEVAGED